MEVATGWSTFANGGYKISPYLIQRIENRDGATLFVANPPSVPANDAKPATNTATFAVNDSPSAVPVNM